MGGFDGTNRFGVNIGDGGGTNPSFRQSKTSTTPLDTNWHHLVFVVRGANDMDIYLDCLNDGGTYSGGGGPMFYGNNGGFIGKTAAGNGPFTMAGKLDDFAMWDRALTSTDVEDICNGGLEGLITAVENPHSTLGLTLFPNPTTGWIELEVSKSYSQGAMATLMDVAGKCIGKVALEGTQAKVDVGQFAAGTYFIRLQNSLGEVVTKKFVKL